MLKRVWHAANGVFSVPALPLRCLLNRNRASQGTGLPADPDGFSSPYGDAILFSRGFGADITPLEYDNSGRYSVLITLTSGSYQFDISDNDSITLGNAELDVAAGSIALGSAGNLFSVQLDTAGSYKLLLDVTTPTPQISLTLNNALVDCALPDSSEPAPFAVAGSGSYTYAVVILVGMPPRVSHELQRREQVPGRCRF